jgi:predicted ATPase
MSINRLQVKNFKSFKDLDIELGNLNIIIGANASGKSNFINIFRFLKDISTFGLENAVSLQGGIEYLRNINLGNKEEFEIKISNNKPNISKHRFKDRKVTFVADEVNYNLKLFFSGRKNVLKVSKHISELTGNVFKVDEEFNETDFIGKGKITLSLNNDKICEKFESDNLTFDIDDLYPIQLLDSLHLNKKLILEKFFLSNTSVYFFDSKIFDFDPKLPKKAIPITGKADLEEDGSNLSIVLRNIISDKDKKRKFNNLIKELLPFVKNMEVENTSDKSLLFRMQEIYSGKEFLPASFLSDGTINLTALIIALYFEKRCVTIIEEPERNIHPNLMSKLMEMMKDASKSKQIIITTHNPEIVKNADINDIYLMVRDRDGFSKIVKPKDSNSVQTFLDNDMTLDELYVQNLLES